MSGKNRPPQVMKVVTIIVLYKKYPHIIKYGDTFYFINANMKILFVRQLLHRLHMISKKFPVPAEHLSFMVKSSTFPSLMDIISVSCPPTSIIVLFVYVLTIYVQCNIIILQRVINTKFRDLEKIITADDWLLKSIVGSHYHYIHLSKSGKVTIPNHKGDV